MADAFSQYDTPSGGDAFSKFENTSSSGGDPFAKYDSQGASPATPQNAVVKTFPANLGGGAYYSVPGQPNELYNGGHTDYGGKPVQKGMQRDDIMPVGLGGVNANPQNIRYEPSGSQGTATDPIEKQAIADYRAGKIGLEAARLKVMTAKQQEMGLTPTNREQTTAGQFLPALGDLFSHYLNSLKSGLKGVQGGQGVVNPNKVDPAYLKHLSDMGAAVYQPDGKLNLDASFEKVKALKQGKESPVNAAGLSPTQAKTAQNVVETEAQKQQAENQQIAAEEKNMPLGDVNRHPIAALGNVAGGLFLGPELIEAPLATGAKVALFSGLNAVANKLNLKLSNLAPNASNNTKDVLDLLQMTGEGLVSHGVYENAPSVADAFTKDLVTHYNLPDQVHIPADVIKDVFQTGTKATPEQLDQFTKLTGGDRTKINAAIQNGLDVNVPAEKFVGMVDKPWFAALKNKLGMQPFEPIFQHTPLGEVSQAPAGLLNAPKEAPATPFQALHDQVQPAAEPIPNVSHETPPTVTEAPTTPFQALEAQISPKTAPSTAIEAPKAETPTQPSANIPKELQPLAEEAKKYKSAEEFVNNNIKKDYVSEVKPTKLGYGDSSVFKTSGEARGNSREITNKEIEIAKRDQKIFDVNKNKSINELQNEIKNSKKFSEENNASYDRSIQVKEELVKQKSQLSDIWNQAHQTPAEPAKTPFQALHEQAQPAPEKMTEPLRESVTPNVSRETSQPLLDQAKGTNLNDFIKSQNIDNLKAISPELHDQAIKKLTDIHNEANRPVQTRETPVKTTLKTVGTGEEKLSTAATKLAARLEEHNLGKAEEIPEYKVATDKEAIEKYSKMRTEDPSRALNIAMGTQAAPKGELASTYWSLMSNEAELNGDSELGLKLASSPVAKQGTAAGQFTQKFSLANPNSSIAKIQEIQKNMETPEKVQKSDYAKKVVNEETSKINLSPEELKLEKFLDEIAC